MWILIKRFFSKTGHGLIIGILIKRFFSKTTNGFWTQTVSEPGDRCRLRWASSLLCTWPLAPGLPHDCYRSWCFPSFGVCLTLCLYCFCFAFCIQIIALLEYPFQTWVLCICSVKSIKTVKTSWQQYYFVLLLCRSRNDLWINCKHYWQILIKSLEFIKKFLDCGYCITLD